MLHLKNFKSRLAMLVGLLLTLNILVACSTDGQTPTTGTLGPSSPGATPSRAVNVTTAAAPSPTTAPTAAPPTPTPAPVVTGLKLAGSTAAVPGHLSEVTVMSFSQDGKVLATGSDDQTVRLWNASTFENQELAVLKGHFGPIASIAFSPDSKLVATGSYDYTIRLWEVATGRQLALLQGHTGGVHALAYSPDRQFLASGSGDKTIKIWHIPDAKLITTLTGHGDKVNSVAFSPDGKLLASGSGDWQVKLWDVASWQERATFKGHSTWVQTVVFSPDSHSLASLSGDKSIKIWPVPASGGSPAPVARLTFSYQENLPGSGLSKDRPLAFSPDGQTLTALTSYGLQRWNATTGQSLGSVAPIGPDDTFICVGLSGDGQLFATAIENIYPPIVVKIYQVVGENEHLGSNLLATYGATPSVISTVHSVAYSPGGQYYATGSWDYPAGTFNFSLVVRIWRTADNALLNTIQGEYNAANALAFSPTGETLAGLGVPAPPTRPPDNSYTGDLKIWEVPGGKLILSQSTHSNGDEDLVFSPDGKAMAIAGGSREGNDTVEVRSFPGGQNLASLSSNIFPTVYSHPNSVGYSPDGHWLAAGTSHLIFDNGGYNNLYGSATSGAIELWDAFNGYKSVASLPNIEAAVLAVAFNPNGKELVSGGVDGKLKFWKLDQANPTPQLAATLPAHLNGVRHILFSRDGRVMATSGEDHTIKLWDTATRRLIFSTAPSESYGVSDIAFSPDGKMLLSGHSDGSVKRWQVTTTGG